MRLDHLLSKETSDKAMRLSVTSYWSVQSVKVFTLFNLEGTVSKYGEPLNGGLAQLGERLPCKQEVTGSIPVLSTKRSLGYGPIAQLARAHD